MKPLLCLAATLVLAAAARPAGAAEGDEVGRQVRAAEAAAEALEGALDGRWILADAAGRPLFIIELTSATGGSRLQGAWRSVTGEEGVLDSIAARRGRLDMRLGRLAVRLGRVGGVWRGVLERRGHMEPVILRR